jgi:hypothetical protein
MEGVVKVAFRGVALLLLVLVAGLALYACGGSDDTGAEELARQQEIQAAREEAAQDVRQSTRIGQLERRLRRRSAQAPEGKTYVPPSSSSVAVEAGEALLGVWRGEAVISYDDGKTDPFFETVQIDSLIPGERAGYAEAVQGSTTCHGPLTYQGVSEGWYSFSSEEQNVAECIDYSQVELRFDGSGGLSYRETTDASVSEGELERVS